MRRFSSSRRSFCGSNSSSPRRWPLAWGDKSTPWDWAYRVLSISDDASSALGGDKLAKLWLDEKLVFRTHAAKFYGRPTVDEIDVSARVIAVGRTSFQYECDLGCLATTRGTFVHINEGKSHPLPDDVVAVLRESIEPSTFHDVPRCPPEEEGLMSAADVPVRHSDCDSLGHVNNAKYVHYIFDVLRQHHHHHSGDDNDPPWPSLLALDYLSPALPGDILTPKVTLDNTARIHLRRSSGPCVAGSVEFK